MQTDLINKNTDLFGADGSIQVLESPIALRASLADSGARLQLLEAPIALQTATIESPLKGIPISDVDTSEYDSVPCQELSNRYGIIAGQSFGSADEKVRNSWIKRGCNTKPSGASSDEAKPAPKLAPKPTPKPASKPTDDAERTADDDDAFEAEDGDNGSDDGKIFGMPKGVVIGLGISVALIGGFLVYKKFIAKK